MRSLLSHRRKRFCSGCAYNAKLYFVGGRSILLFDPYNNNNNQPQQQQCHTIDFPIGCGQSRIPPGGLGIS
ncbi:hypothetical protein O6P43_021086 [Quillaja saponaria]|uniref:Uncharacterized protein n=1 Tax=Quillaja saponaria TaxID=32244 RepID=A0AAD7LNN2_QUISA|nr:hypothetical protein O6P43_021086 [Quillaja saponaria]